MTKFKVGDKVRVKKGLKSYIGLTTVWDEMLEHIGKEYKVVEVADNGNVRFKECGFYFPPETVEFVKTNDKNFKLKAGDRVYYINQWGQKRDTEIYAYDGDTIEQFEDDGSKVLKVERKQVVYEAEEEILDEVEKKYLEGVIRPFRKRIKCIRKRTSLSSRKKQFIQIIYYEGGEELGMGMPDFKKDTMYKGMETNREYSLEELGL